MKPVRLQLSRQRGFDLQDVSRLVNGLAAINVSRAGKFKGQFGNIFKIGVDGDRTECVRKHRQALEAAMKKSLATRPPFGWIARNLHLLRGHNIACVCRPDEPCHGDIYLELANR